MDKQDTVNKSTEELKVIKSLLEKVDPQKEIYRESMDLIEENLNKDEEIHSRKTQ